MKTGNLILTLNGAKATIDRELTEITNVFAAGKRPSDEQVDKLLGVLYRTAEFLQEVRYGR